MTSPLVSHSTESSPDVRGPLARLTDRVFASGRGLLRGAEIVIDATTARLSPPFSRLYVASDGSDWVLNEEARALVEISRSLGFPARHLQSGSTRGISGQVLFHSSQWALRELAAQSSRPRPNRFCFSYFHGVPSAEQPEFAECFALFKKLHPAISRVQVSHRAMHTFLLESGIEPQKLALIPIGINLDFFPFRSAQSRLAARLRLGIPESAFVVGSFQKDGNGWGEGNEPKLIKGPDVLLEVLAAAKPHIPELYVLLSGPSRGFVKRGLTERQIPFQHQFLNTYREVAHLFEACDAVLVTSREEGGPKAVLESMACGVPLISTKVGQAVDLVVPGENGFLAPVEDVESLSQQLRDIARAPAEDLATIVAAGRRTAEAHAYPAQLELWRSFFRGVVA